MANKADLSEDYDVCVCEYCGAEISWSEGAGINGNIWSCEKCGNYFCSLCADLKGGKYTMEEENVLCHKCTKAES